MIFDSCIYIDAFNFESIKAQLMLLFIEITIDRSDLLILKIYLPKINTYIMYCMQFIPKSKSSIGQNGTFLL